MRDDFEQRDFAKENGFEEIFHVQDKMHKRFLVPHFSIQFRRGNTFVWYCSLGWQVADLIDGHYKNHRPEKELRKALEKVIKEQERKNAKSM